MMDNIQQLVVPNACTIGDTYTASVMCDDKQHIIEFYLGTRDGSTKTMITETLRHFISAISSVANGDVDSAEGMVHPRTDYGDWQHNEARIAIWVKAPGVPVLMPRGMRFVQVNVFTEATSAQDFIDSVNEHVYTMADIVESGAIAIKSAPKQKSELDNHFGERKSQKVTEPQQLPPQTDHQPTNPRLYAEVYDYLPQERRLEVEQRCVGQKVGLRLGAIERELAKFDNGDTADRIRFWSPTGDYAYSATICVKIDERDNNYTLKAFKDRAADLWKALPATGYKIPCDGIAVFKLNQGKGDYAHKVYWNFLSIVADEQQAKEQEHPPSPAGAYDQESDDSFSNMDYDSIPF